MRKAMKFGHLLGLAVFLGSIFTFAVASEVPESGDVVSLSVARRVISAGTSFLTLPALCVLVVSGLGLLWGGGSVMREGWLRVMLFAAMVIVANTVLVVTPAVRSATALAQEAVNAGQVPAGYSRAYTTESAAGAVNIILTLVAMVCGVWRFGSRREAFPVQGASRPKSGGS